MVEMLGEIAAKPDDGLGRFRNGWLGGFHAGKIQQGARHRKPIMATCATSDGWAILN